MRSLQLIFFFIPIFLLLATSARAESVYRGVNPERDEVAKGVCEMDGGEYLGNFAMKKSEDGSLHPDGPAQEQIEFYFYLLSEYLQDHPTQVDPMYQSSTNWQWLELRFACFQANIRRLSFVLRARSGQEGDLLRTYELTYLFNGENVARQSAETLDLRDLKLSAPQNDGLAIDGGVLRSAPQLDENFVRAILWVAFGNPSPYEDTAPQP